MPRIYDCFTFFNELDLLEIRLNELDPVVDSFVLCEAPVTFKGKPKPLVFKENRERFTPFLHKITHIVVDDMPGGDGKPAFWNREKFQRNALVRGLDDAKADDFVILSDLDEIPRASVTEQLARQTGRPRIFSLQMENHCFYVNLRTGKWNRSRVALRGDIRTLERLRDGGPTWRPKHPYFWHTMRQWKRMAFGLRRLRPWVVVADAGWHFTNLNGPEVVSGKLHAYSHRVPESKASVEGVITQIRETLERAARPGGHHRILELDDSLPAYLIANKKRFAHLIADRQTFERYGVTPPPELQGSI